MTEVWHRTADLVGLPGMPNGPRPIRLHDSGRGWISRQAKWGKRTVLEWLESSLPAETQAALRGETVSSHPASAPETEVPRRDTSTEGDGSLLTSPPSLFSDSSTLAIADARAGIVAAFERHRAGSGLAIVPAMKQFAAAYPDVPGIDAETRERIPSFSWNTLQRWRAAR